MAHLSNMAFISTEKHIIKRTALRTHYFELKLQGVSRIIYRVLKDEGLNAAWEILIITLL